MEDSTQIPFAEPTNETEARKIIDQIRFQHGIITKEDEAELIKTSVEFQNKSRSCALQARTSSAAFAKLAATQLYSSKFRFIYELIQNADDSSYTKHVSKGIGPKVKFTLQPGRIIIESNEDGFTVKDVSAICTTAQSSKKGNQNTIGSKGLGFKSVFAISERVTIQSGIWSFEFKYLNGDDGSGMITPYWTDLEQSSYERGTKITLYLKKKKDKAFAEELRTAFEDVPDTTLLFLRQIDTLIIYFEQEEHDIAPHVFARHGDWNDAEKSISVDIKGDKEHLLYKMYGEEVLVASSSSTGGDDSTPQQRVRVELAFPVQEHIGLPKLSSRGQHIFAFLPMKRMAQLPFIIQADFDTAASREAVVDETRNRELRDAVAVIFANAVEEFCEEENELKYSWMQYVPGDQLDDFWVPLREKILESLAQKALLAAKGVEGLHQLATLRFVPSSFQHQEEPLLPSDNYLSEIYDEDAVDVLRSLGVPDLENTEMLDLVEQDLARSSDSSKIRSTDLDDSWHTTFAEFLLDHICDKSILEERLGNIPVIPVLSGNETRWCQPNAAYEEPRIYFPRIDGHHDAPIIDAELGLQTIDLKAYSLPERRNLYRYWGIGHADPGIVVKAVVAKNTMHNSASLQQYVAHFAIMFWHRKFLVRRPPVLWGASKRYKSIDSTKLYFSSQAQYSTNKLLNGQIDHEKFGFLHDFYFADHLKRPFHDDGGGWESWLSNVAGVRHHPSLIDIRLNITGISPLFQEIIRKVPSKVVGTLEAHWKEYKEQVARYPGVLKDLKNALVLCRNGEKKQLCQTVLPTEETIVAGRLFGVEQNIPYLQMETDSDFVKAQDWSFLQVFDVCLTTTLKFHLDALEFLAKQMSLPSESSTESWTYALELYRGIKSVATMNDKEQLQEFFRSQAAILTSRGWCNVSRCVWSGPDFPIAKVVLAKEYANQDFARDLFVNLLGIGPATHKDILQELERLSTAGSRAHVEVATISDVYRELEKKVDWRHMGLDIRSTFETKALIYDGLGWQKLLSCVWSSAVSLPGKIVLNKHYPDMSVFFIEKLGVKIMNTTLLLEEFIRLSDGKIMNKDEVKSLLREIASMLSNEEPTDKVDDLLRKLRECRFLPLLDYSVSEDGYDEAFATPEEEFLIVDEQRFGDAFRNTAVLLDFSATELTSLEPLFTALRLKSRYLSHQMKTETSVEDRSVHGRLTHDLRRRCSAIACCVFSHKGPHEQEEINDVHERLMKSEVCTSPSMHTTFSLKQFGETKTVQSQMINMKIDLESDIIRVFMPEDQTQLSQCYRTYLPGHLLRSLGVFAPSAEKQMYRILNEPIPTLRDILSEEGIEEKLHLEGSYQSIEDRLEGRDQSGGDTLVERLEAVHLDEAPVAYRTTTDVDDRPYNYLDPIVVDQVAETYSRERFRKVLEHVVKQAHAVEGAQTNGSNGDAGSVPPCRGDVGNNVASDGSWKRIGAAGELFVLERLRTLGVTDLNVSNWQSNIRQLVSGLPQYDGLEEYGAQEEADIMYTDVSGEMERIIRAYGFNKPTWPEGDHTHEPIEFYVEVKTTINSCDDQFWVTRHQHELLTKNALLQGQRPKIVYIIARVYNLLSAKIGVKFFVDPKSLEGRTLRFEWEKCGVKSSTGQ